RRLELRGTEELAGVDGERRVAPAELEAVEICQLEVVADELGLALSPFEPARESFVQLRARSLGNLRIRRVADQRVAEAEAVVAEERRCLRAHELLADEREQGRSDRAALAVRGELGDRTAPELLADDGGALEHRSLERLEPVEARGEERLDRRRQLGGRIA